MISGTTFLQIQITDLTYDGYGVDDDVTAQKTFLRHSLGGVGQLTHPVGPWTHPGAHGGPLRPHLTTFWGWQAPQWTLTNDLLPKQLNWLTFCSGGEEKFPVKHS